MNMDHVVLYLNHPVRMETENQLPHFFYGWIVILADKAARIVYENDVACNGVMQNVMQFLEDRCFDPALRRRSP